MNPLRNHGQPGAGPIPVVVPRKRSRGIAGWISGRTELQGWTQGQAPRTVKSRCRWAGSFLGELSDLDDVALLAALHVQRLPGAAFADRDVFDRVLVFVAGMDQDVATAGPGNT